MFWNGVVSSSLLCFNYTLKEYVYNHPLSKYPKKDYGQKYV